MSSELTSKERVANVLKCRRVDRQPHFDILRSDAVIEHFAGEKLTHENAYRVTRVAAARALDATRGVPKLPVPEHEEVLPDGRKVRYERWTRWVEPKKYGDVKEYAREKQRLLSGSKFDGTELLSIKHFFNEYVRCQREYFQNIAFFWVLGAQSRKQFGVDVPNIGGNLLSEIYGELGIEQFSFFLYDDKQIFLDLFDYYTKRAIIAVEMIPEEDKPFGILIADDLAFKSGPILPPAFFEQEYFGRLQRIVEAIHRRGIYVMFHSDGNLNKLLDGLVSTGIDMLNPIEILAGMDVGDIHKRYPGLVMAGGIDVSQLLAFGSPLQVKDAVCKAINDAEGRILIGSTTEIHNGVPLKNFLALQEALLTT
ncbi:MAG: hypothetical protein HY606_12300 [Planctomycetes bacterium]|nr:hypothetical protein [Planctomycetota bacterium]